MSSWDTKTPPKWHPTAIATPKGWVDPVTGELLVAIVGLSTTKEPNNAPALVSVYFDKLKYKLGDVLNVIAQYHVPVTVTGTPTVTISINGTNHTLNYGSGSGTAFLKFPYTVISSDIATPGQLGISSPISLNGGTIKGTADTHNAGLTFSTPATSIAKTLVDGVLPTISSITANTGTVSTNQTLTFLVHFTKPVIKTGKPTLTVNFSDSATTGAAAYSSGSDTNVLAFNYIVQKTDKANLGNVSLSSPVLTSNSTIVGSNAGNPATLTFSGQTFPLLGVNDIGGVLSVAASGGSGATALDFQTGDVMSFAVNFDVPVTVTGSPLLPINIHSTAKNATYASGSGTNTLIFNYTVLSGDNASQSQLTTGTALSLNSGTMKNSSGSTVGLTFSQASFTLATVNQAIVTGVTAPTAGNYATGAVLSFVASFNENVTVTGSPQIGLTVGVNSRQAVYASGSGTKNLTFSYTVVSGDAAVASGVTLANTIALNSGTILNGASVAATLSITPPVTSGMVVNDPAPTFTAAAFSTSGTLPHLVTGNTAIVTLTASKAVTVTGVPQIQLNITSGAKQALYVSGSGTTSLVFSYPVIAGDICTAGNFSTAATVVLNGGTVKDALGTNAVLTFTAPTTSTVALN